MTKYIIVDIDQTLCHTPHYNTLEEYHKLDHINFKPKQKNIDYLYNYIQKKYWNIDDVVKTVLITARCESLRKVTEFWLANHAGLYLSSCKLLMRPIQDKSEDFNLKHRLYLCRTEGLTEEIHTWFDDNPQILKEGERLGINIVDLNVLAGETMAEEFKKFDNDKLDLTLVPTILGKHYASIAQMGAKKYGRNNWKQAKIEDVRRYYAAMQRHQMAELDGQYLDPESGMPHGWHALWNRTAINYFVEQYGYDEVFKHII